MKKSAGTWYGIGGALEIGSSRPYDDAQRPDAEICVKSGSTYNQSWQPLVILCKRSMPRPQVSGGAVTPLWQFPVMWMEWEGNGIFVLWQYPGGMFNISTVLLRLNEQQIFCLIVSDSPCGSKKWK